MKSRTVLFITSWLFILTVGFGCSKKEKPLASALTIPKSRLALVLRDVTPSYKSIVLANNKIRTIVDALGPGDGFLLADIAPKVSPKKTVRVQCNMPDVPQDLFKPVSNLSQWKQNQARLNAIWEAVEKNKQTISNWLLRPVELKRGGTDIFSSLEYCAQRLSRESEREKYVVIFSDLVHEVSGKVKTEKPPSISLNFEGVRISALFVPWRDKDSWEKKENAWKTFFVPKSGALFFSMYDAAESRLQSLLPPSRIPRRLKSPFNE